MPQPIPSRLRDRCTEVGRYYGHMAVAHQPDGRMGDPEVAFGTMVAVGIDIGLAIALKSPEAARVILAGLDDLSTEAVQSHVHEVLTDG